MMLMQALTPLAVASRGGHLKTVQMLLKAGADPTINGRVCFALDIEVKILLRLLYSRELLWCWQAQLDMLT
eukprot:m.33012 g.33012  ORF g.33012 m.33012 type:complete len:71 (-) comp12190_c0_seq22:1070-1282(-)